MPHLGGQALESAWLVLPLTALLLLLALVWLNVAHNGGHSFPETSWNAGQEAVVVNAWAGVRLLAAPEEGAATLGALRSGEPVRVVEERWTPGGQQWLKVSWSQGRLLGWLPARHLEPAGLIAGQRT